jgi:hypothetical protein
MLLVFVKELLECCWRKANGLGDERSKEFGDV